MNEKQQLAMELGRKYKRLKYWQTAFQTEPISPESVAEISAILETYALLISKLSGESDATAAQECLQRLASVERQLTSAFENFRLSTSALHSQ